MLDKILGRLGLVRASRIDEVLVQENWESFDSNKFDILKDKLRGCPEFKEYCDWTIVQDIKRFYSSHPTEHPIIRGAISRTKYFRNLCVEEDSKKLPIQRYV